MNTLSPDEKLLISIKRGILNAVIEEYIRSDEEYFLVFLNNCLGNYNYTTYLSDSELLKRLAEYNDANKMNEALE